MQAIFLKTLDDEEIFFLNNLSKYFTAKNFGIYSETVLLYKMYEIQPVHDIPVAPMPLRRTNTPRDHFCLSFHKNFQPKCFQYTISDSRWKE